MMRRKHWYWISLWIVITGVVLWLMLTGCAATQPQTKFSTSQPVDLQQVSGAIAAAVRAEVETSVTGLSYTSQLGIGSTLLIGVTLVLTLCLSHRREMARIQRNGGSK